MENKNDTPILLLTGYLGSGKTTLLNEILANKRGIKFAVIVNDIGEVNIDAALIRDGGIVGQTEESSDLIALQNGCICCSLQTDLMKQIDDLISTHQFDYIVIEASGICEPAPIAQTICTMADASEKYGANGVPRLDCICTVVDALRMASEFACGESLQAFDRTDDDIESLVISQVEFCNIVILNKISEVSREDAGRVRAVIRALQPKAKIIETDYTKIDLEEIINTNLFDFEKVATSATWVREIEGHHDEEHDEEHEEHHHHHEHEHHHHHEHHEHHGEHCHCHECEEHHAHLHYGIETFLYYTRKPFDLNKFDYFAGKQWPTGVIRCKGLCYFSNNRDMCYLFEQAGVQKNLKQAGYWFATAPAEELEVMMARDAQLRRDWDPEYGDRMIKLVFIGQHLDKEAITKTLDACLA